MTKPRCPAEFAFPVRKAIVRAMGAAYAEADDVYAPERGRGDHLHALAVYHVASFRLRIEFEDLAGITYASRGQGPELWIGPRRIRWNKVGRGGDGQSIQGSFPRASRAAAFMAEENQLRMFDESAFDVDGFPTNWIIAHLGNPLDGLVAVYLASPIETDGRSVSAWRDIVPIWSATDPDAEFPAAPMPGPPEPNDIGQLDVDLLDEDTAAGEA